jgi:hypothetical protein
MRTNNLTLPQWDQTSAGTGQPSAGHKQAGTGEGEEDAKTGDCRVRTETAKGGESMCEGKSVIELSDFEQYSSDSFITHLCGRVL